MTTAYIGVGSNLGDRSENIEKSRRLLIAADITVRRVSPLYESKALCRPGETMPDFVNGVFEIETNLSPEELLDRLEMVEGELGRKEKGNWQPRVIDLDLLLYGNEVIQTARLKAPHPEIERRWFVLKPLVDLNPELRHPVTKKTMEELYADIH
ncbi:MAG: 2-amino-4-hydroxy-6-hydroxymethyldihydropteridine diphosphokinase [Deltaproteobacteria bacterium]|nr:2-amino-4-hydroxy-6-hydroxymethyldihydropteridine diphosphokinase [Deltaproteobacteria bacterium]MBI4373696.1 2-amino-4-hydroxy-6-hydroxymethyldihydropteridine diphosphokinase [Deltaproteobacteria bacterium]